MRTLARGYSLVAGFVAEVVLTFMFLMIILGVTDPLGTAGFCPLAIGLGLTLIHLIGIPVTNLSVNPARSTGPAVLVGGWALAQLWLFWVAPICAAVAGVAYRALAGGTELLSNGQQAGYRRAARPGYPADLGCPADHQAGPV